MANIFQRIFLSKDTCKLIDAIRQNRIESEITENPSFTAATIIYKIVTNGTKIISTMRWDHAQGSCYSLAVSNMESVAQPQYCKIANEDQKYARDIFLRMQQKYRAQQFAQSR